MIQFDDAVLEKLVEKSVNEYLRNEVDLYSVVVSAVKKQVTDAVIKEAQAEVSSTLKRQLEQALDTEYTITDRYGTVQGKNTLRTLAAKTTETFLKEQMTLKTGSYGSKTALQEILEDIFRKEVYTFMHKEVTKMKATIVEEAAKKLKEMVG